MNLGGVRLALLAALALLGACHRAVPAEVARPPLWVITDASGPRAWIFGTVHALPKGVRWQGPAIVDAVKDADRLVLELGADFTPGAAQDALRRLGFTRGLPPPSARVPAERRGDLQALYGKIGVNDDAFADEESWAVALQLAAMAASREGIVAENGVEPALKALAKRKPVAGLETLDEQLGAFDRLSPEAQAVLLGEVAKEAAHGDDLDRDMTALWVKGDERGLDSEAHKGFLATPALRAAVLTRRTAAWAAELDAMIRRGDRPFVAVGAAHVVGADGLPALMARRGYVVKRVQ